MKGDFHDSLRSNRKGGTGFQPVSDLLTIRQRNLPHWEMRGATYFLTFRLSRAVGSETLIADERAAVKQAILFWHEVRWDVHLITIMPDHAHILATLLKSGKDQYFSLSIILHSIKRHSAREINQRRQRTGELWQSETFDRIIRNSAEFDEKANYILQNAVRAGLGEDGWQYDGFWCENDAP